MLLNCGTGEYTWESLDCKEIKPVNPKGNQPWIFFGRTNSKAEAPTVWPPDAKSWLTGKDPDPGKDWRQKEKRMRWLDRVSDFYELRKLQKIVSDGEACCAAVHRVTKSQTWLTELNWTGLLSFNSPNSPGKKRFLPLVYRWGNWGPESLITSWRSCS